MTSTRRPKSPAPQTTTDEVDLLLRWYRAQRRDLPWRRTKDPYAIWISEVMLQQTTVAAVIPYYEKFLRTFPDVATLANAPEGAVLEAWAGLGYYSRARNLHKSAKALARMDFPRTAEALLELPGFGPYTSRAVASIAFEDPVGVLDGNVIRVISRFRAWDLEWWNQKARAPLQTQADAWARVGPPSEVNQALMELGATICTPAKPACLLCPWNGLCQAREQDLTSTLPRPKPRRATEIWHWRARVQIRAGKVALARNSSGPVLKDQWIFPGEFTRLRAKPKAFDVRHGITHHDLFVTIDDSRSSKSELRDVELRWIELDRLASVSPMKLLDKVLQKKGVRS
jgi:A/G-specific adenine glycosylase